MGAATVRSCRRSKEQPQRVCGEEPSAWRGAAAASGSAVGHGRRARWDHGGAQPDAARQTCDREWPARRGRPAARSGRRGVAAWLGAGGAARWAQDEALPEWNGCRVFAFIVGEGKIWAKFAPRHCSKVAFATGHQKRLVWPQHTLGCWLFVAGH